MCGLKLEPMIIYQFGLRIAGLAYSRSEEDVYSYISADVMRPFHARLCLWLLLVACEPSWVEESVELLYNDYKVPPLGYRANAVKSFLWDSLGDLEHMYTTSSSS